jgi:CheY-like chemotaxis protein
MERSFLEPTPARSGCVLLVEDDRDIREILAETLTDLGFEVATAANGLDALELVRGQKARPGVILLDLMMPVMDGYAFLEERSKDPELATVPVLVITAGYRVDRRRLGRVRVIWKPFDLPRLVGALRELQDAKEGPAT